MPRVCPQNCGAKRCTHEQNERTKRKSTRSLLGFTWDGEPSKGKWRSGSSGSGSRTQRRSW